MSEANARPLMPAQSPQAPDPIHLGFSQALMATVDREVRALIDGHAMRQRIAELQQENVALRQEIAALKAPPPPVAEQNQAAQPAPLGMARSAVALAPVADATEAAQAA